MDLNPSEEQQQLIDAFGALYAKESSCERVRAAEPVGHDADLWRRLVEVGALEMAVDEERSDATAKVYEVAGGRVVVSWVYGDVITQLVKQICCDEGPA